MDGNESTWVTAEEPLILTERVALGIGNDTQARQSTPSTQEGSGSGHTAAAPDVRAHATCCFICWSRGCDSTQEWLYQQAATHLCLCPREIATAVTSKFSHAWGKSGSKSLYTGCTSGVQHRARARHTSPDQRDLLSLQIQVLTTARHSIWTEALV